MHEINHCLTNFSERRGDILDILIFTSCNMGTQKIASSFHYNTTYFMACIDEMPATGLPHTNVVEHLHPSLSLEDICIRIYEEYNTYKSWSSSSLSIWCNGELIY